MANKYVKNRIQLFNPRAKYWVKINTKTGWSMSHKKTPYKNIKQIWGIRDAEKNKKS